jgi:hypothetical protein
MERSDENRCPKLEPKTATAMVLSLSRYFAKIAVGKGVSVTTKGTTFKSR